jgi:hypothetical protein
MGDCGTGSKEQKKVSYQVHRHDRDFVFIPGDIVYNKGRISEYRTSFFPVYSPEEPAPEAGAPLLRANLFLAGVGRHRHSASNPSQAVVRTTLFLAGVAQHDTEAALNKHPDGFAYYLYWSQPLNCLALKAGTSNTYPLGGSTVQQKALLDTAGERYPRMANFSFDYGNAHWTVLNTWNSKFIVSDRLGFGNNFIRREF